MGPEQAWTVTPTDLVSVEVPQYMRGEQRGSGHFRLASVPGPFVTEPGCHVAWV